MTKLTDLEYRLMDVFAHCEMNESNGLTPKSADEVRTYLWADARAIELEISEQAVGGLLTSLQNKGFIGIVAPNCKFNADERGGSRGGNRDPDGGFWFTEEGFAAWKEKRSAS